MNKNVTFYVFEALVRCGLMWTFYLKVHKRANLDPMEQTSTHTHTHTHTETHIGLHATTAGAYTALAYSVVRQKVTV